MNRIRLVVSIILAAAVVAIAALAVFPPKEFVKGRLVAEVKAATGRELVIKGATSLRLLPSFVLRVEDVELENPPGVSGEALFTAHAVLIESSLWAVVTSSNVFDRISLEGPRIALAVDAKSQPNWSMPPGGGPAISVRHVAIAGGVLTYRDGGGNEALSVRGLDGAVRELAGGNIAQLELDAGEAVLRIAAGPQLTFANVDAEAKAIASGIAADLSFKAAKLTYRERPGAQPVEFSAPEATAKTSAGALQAAIAVVFGGDRIAGDLRVANQAALIEGKATPAVIKLAAPKGKLDVDGTLQLAGGGARIEGKTSAAAASLRSLATWAGIELPKTGAFGAVSAEGTVNLEGSRLQFDKLQIALDATKATGSLALDLGGSRPSLSGRLAADSLDVDSYLAAAPLPPPAKKPRTRALVVAAAPAPLPPGSEKETLKQVLRVQLVALDAPPQPGPDAAPDTGHATTRALVVMSPWPDDPFDLAALKAFDADLSLSVAKLVVGGTEIGVPDLKAALKEGVLALDGRNLAVEGAKVTGTASIDLREALPKLAAKFKAQGVDPEAWFELFGKEAPFVGKASVDADLSGSGNSPRKLIDTLTGRIKAATGKGAIVGYDLSSPLGMIAVFLGQYHASWRTPFEELDAELTLANGIARKSAVELTGQIFGINGNGVVKLPSQEIDYRARLNLLTWGQSAAVHILGGWKEPKVNYSVGALASARTLVPLDPLEPFKGADLQDPELAKLAAQVLQKGAEKGTLSPQVTEALEALKARAEGKQ